MSEIVTRKGVKSLLKLAGDEFTTDFIKGCPSAINLRSKEPGICWKAAGLISHAYLAEFSGPNATKESAPVLFRLRTNMYPPPAVFYHLKSPAVQYKLKLFKAPILADGPGIELTATPDEAGKFGGWLTNWFDNYASLKAQPPDSPIQLFSYRWTEDNKTRCEDLSTIGSDWRYCTFLWTEKASKAWADYQMSDKINS